MSNAGILMNNTKMKQKGKKELGFKFELPGLGLDRCNSGVMALVGQAPGMFIVTIPVVNASNRVADNYRKKRKQRKHGQLEAPHHD